MDWTKGERGFAVFSLSCVSIDGSEISSPGQLTITGPRRAIDPVAWDTAVRDDVLFRAPEVADIGVSHYGIFLQSDHSRSG